MERDTAAVVVIVSLVNTAAMILCPLLAEYLATDQRTTVFLIGAAVQDVALGPFQRRADDGFPQPAFLFNYFEYSVC